MITQGKIEAGICDGISRFEQEYMGWRPKDNRFTAVQGRAPAAGSRTVAGVSASSLVRVTPYFREIFSKSGLR